MDRERITEALNKFRVAEPAAEAAPSAPAEGEARPVEAKPAVDVAPTGETKPPEAKPVEAKPAVDTDAYSRMEAKNRELVSELEKLRSAPRSGGSDLATQAAKMYLQDPQRALRMLVAAGLEIEDLESKDIDGELEGLLLEAAGKDLGVPLEPTKKLEHDQRRLRHQLRLQKTESSKPKADDGTAQRLEIIERVATPLVEKYPHARDLAEHIDGKPLREIVNQVILVGLATGEFDGSASNEALVSRALEAIEGRYKSIGDRIVASRKPAESPTSGASDKPGARTVTTSNASVAPTKAPEPPKQEQEKEPASEEERRAAILARHFKR